MGKRNIKEVDSQALSELIARIEAAIEHDLALSVGDMKLLLSAITTLCTLQSKIEQDGVTLHKLRKLLGMVKQSERRPQSNNSASTSKTSKRSKKSSSRSKSTIQEPKVVHHNMQHHQRGEVCQECQRGKLYKYDPAQLIRITGHARYEATKHVVEQLRCNGCQVIIKAPLPESVLADGGPNQKYGYSARALMVIDKFYTGTPYYHQGNLANIFGNVIVASTIYDQCEHVANAVMPVLYELHRQAANGYRFSYDDTRNRILTQQPELREKPNSKGKQLRTGVYTSGLIASCHDGRDIVLFNTSLGHAGEFLDEILKQRRADLPAPLTMSDALSSNSVSQVTIKQAFCNAHSRRLFFDLESIYPKDIEWLLETYGRIWENEDVIKDRGYDDDRRLTYHQKHSLPAMEQLKQWALKKQASDVFEEHSALGKAVKYFLKHYDKLILFCVEPGALIDNNRMEEKLKIPIRGRKTSHFYKTAIGAGVANILISIIATADQANENIYEYLQALQKNNEFVKQDPAAWLPWSYRATLAKLKQSKITESV